MGNKRQIKAKGLMNKNAIKAKGLMNKNAIKARGLMNNKAQGMVIDLIMLVLIAVFFFMFMSSQVANRSADTGIIRSQSSHIQRLEIALLNYEVQNGTYQNATVAELIGMHHCGASLYPTINATIQQAMQDLSRENHYFIFLSESESGLIAVFNNESCVKTETINIAKFRMNLPCSKSSEITLGIWPAAQKVEPC